MIELRPSGVTLETKAQPRILLPNHWVKFSNAFPDSLTAVKTGKVGKTAKVAKQTQVTFTRSWIIKENCYVDVDLSNEDAGEKLYPDNSDNLYEMLIGLKPGNYYLIPYFPADQPIYRLDYPTMSPLVSDAKLRYLGNVNPQDSPAYDEDYPERMPTLRLYLVFNLKPVLLRIVADGGVAQEKCTLQFLVNRCLMQEGTPPENVTPKPIYYLDELKW